MCIKPCVGEKLSGAIESRYLMDKYAVAVQRNGGKVVGHLPLGKSEKFAKAAFWFLKADKNHSCKINMLRKTVSAVNGSETKVHFGLPLFADEK